MTYFLRRKILTTRKYAHTNSWCMLQPLRASLPRRLGTKRPLQSPDRPGSRHHCVSIQREGKHGIDSSRAVIWTQAAWLNKMFPGPIARMVQKRKRAEEESKLASATQKNCAQIMITKSRGLGGFQSTPLKPTAVGHATLLVQLSCISNLVRKSKTPSRRESSEPTERRNVTCTLGALDIHAGVQLQELGQCSGLVHGRSCKFPKAA